MSPDPELIRLQQAVRESRADMKREYSGLVREFDLKRRFTESVKRHPLGWIGGAVSAGLLAALFGTGRPGKVTARAAAAPSASTIAPALSRAGWIAGALEIGKLLYPVLRPVVTELLGNLARSGLAKRGRLP